MNLKDSWGIEMCIRDRFREDPLVEEFLDAELAFCRMMQEIDVKLAEAMDFE